MTVLCKTSHLIQELLKYWTVLDWTADGSTPIFSLSGVINEGVYERQNVLIYGI